MTNLIIFDLLNLINISYWKVLNCLFFLILETTSSILQGYLDQRKGEGEHMFKRIFLNNDNKSKNLIYHNFYNILYQTAEQEHNINLRGCQIYIKQMCKN
jgi:hypothetical protein